MPVLAAPYLGPESRELCRLAGVNYLDRHGNIWLRLDGIYVDRESAKTPEGQKKRLHNLFSPRSSRICRLMLEESTRSWMLTQLAEQAGISLGQAHNTVKKLVRFTDVHFYTTEEPEKWVRALDLRVTESGGNVHLMTPFDDGLLNPLEDRRGLVTVGKIQLYLDLFSYQARGKEQAEFLRASLIDRGARQ